MSLVEASPTAYYEDKTLPSLPSSVLNVMQAGRAANRTLFTSPETASEQMALTFDYVVTGSYSLADSRKVKRFLSAFINVHLRPIIGGLHAPHHPAVRQ